MAKQLSQSTIKDKEVCFGSWSHDQLILFGANTSQHGGSTGQKSPIHTLIFVKQREVQILPLRTILQQSSQCLPNRAHLKVLSAASAHPLETQALTHGPWRIFQIQMTAMVEEGGRFTYSNQSSSGTSQRGRSSVRDSWLLGCSIGSKLISCLIMTTVWLCGLSGKGFSSCTQSHTENT